MVYNAHQKHQHLIYVVSYIKHKHWRHLDTCHIKLMHIGSVWWLLH